nr:interleukin 17 receptor A1a [Nothobranchius furzeri]
MFVPTAKRLLSEAIEGSTRCIILVKHPGVFTPSRKCSVHLRHFVPCVCERAVFSPTWFEFVWNDTAGLLGVMVKMELLLRTMVLVLGVATSSALNILSGQALRCSRQDVNCTVKDSNCLDPGWQESHSLTPAGAEGLQVSVETKVDDAGWLQPVLHAEWELKDDGSINYLKATELHVLVMSTNENRCIRYSFRDKLKMRSPSEEKWSFFSDVLVLQPGLEYRVSIDNIPKPEQGHTHYDVSKSVRVPDCSNSKMQETQFCKETGSDWKPDVSMSLTSTNNSLAVSFSPHVLSEKYMLKVSCGTSKFVPMNNSNQARLNVTLNLDTWPKSCCQFEAEVTPSFPKCANDCIRHIKTQDFCSYHPTDQPSPQDSLTLILVVLGIVPVCLVIAIVSCVCCRHKAKPHVTPSPEKPPQPPKSPPKILVIYSKDHHLYRDVVLKMCAFLQAKCGTRVLVDLLDTTSVSMVGRLRWLEWQRQQLIDPCDKILVLCSCGVQAKWRAMCGQGKVTLREDVLSPTDDMLIPFLNLFLPDMHQVGMLGKYMVAYFDDICSEKDVPSVFDIGIKYNLMKHFEELYFRILDIEKYQPGQVNHIEGISGDEYFTCPSGQALRKAIETFKDYQLENPDWFEKECVESEEEVFTEASQLTGPLQVPPVFECIIPVRDGLPVSECALDINENNSVHILVPELNPEGLMSSVAELLPVINPEWEHQYPSSLAEVLTEPSSILQPVCIAEPALNNRPPIQQNLLSFIQESPGNMPIEDNEEDSLLQANMEHSAYLDQRCSMDSGPQESSCPLNQRTSFPSAEISHPGLVEMEVGEVLGPSEKRSSSGSDQGYISKGSSQHEVPIKEDPIVALARLQEELFQGTFGYSDIDPEEN